MFENINKVYNNIKHIGHVDMNIQIAYFFNSFTMYE